MLGAGVSVPAGIQIVLACCLCVACGAVMLRGKTCDRIWWLITALLVLEFLLDQHRLQPWAYQTAIYATVFAAMPVRSAHRWLVPLAASVYIYSSLGKFDYQFVHTVGINFLSAFAGPIGGLPEDVDAAKLAKFAFLFPVGELVIGVSLLVPRSRRVAGVAAIVMHGVLIGMLGPWGMNHSPGVLIWNALLILQSWQLFLLEEAGEQTPQWQDTKERKGYSGVARLAIVVAIVMPLTERTGYWDHWPSWALYSPHNSRVDVQIHRSGVELLSPQMQAHVQTDADGDGWQTLSLEQWSLEHRRAAIYPQARYQLRLAIVVARSADIDKQIRGRLRGVSDRFTGKRSENQLLSRTEMEAAANQFWLIPHH